MSEKLKNKKKFEVLAAVLMKIQSFGIYLVK
jgi:hypothetical protein